MERKLAEFKRLLEVMDRLRVECPWDRKQTFESLRNNTIEETYELIDAITDGNMSEIREELGDLMLHIVFYSKIAEEQGSFDIGDVSQGICQKLIYRHPHVFGDTRVDGADNVMQNWEDLKIKEKAAKLANAQASDNSASGSQSSENAAPTEGVLSGVPRSLPALVKAFRLGQKAASAGFDWEKKEHVWDKVKEEALELQQEFERGDKQRAQEEFGDLLFALINAARLYDIDPQAALDGTNRKFIKRFSHVEQGAQKQGKTLRELSLQQMDELWNEAKAAQQKE